MSDKFGKIKVGDFFKANGMDFKKIDQLSYIDPSDPGMEHMINPIFEVTIGERVAKSTEVDTTAKYVVDANTRIIRPNPNYDMSGELKVAALDAFSDFWGTGYFDCDPEDIRWMADRILEIINVENVPSDGPSVSKADAARTKKKPTPKAQKKVVKKSTAKKVVVPKATKKATKKGRR